MNEKNAMQGKSQNVKKQMIHNISSERINLELCDDSGVCKISFVRSAGIEKQKK